MKSAEFIVLRRVASLLKRINIHPAYFGVPVLLSIVAAALEGLGAALMIPVLSGFLTRDYSFIKETPALGAALRILPDNLTSSDRMLFGVLMFMLIVVFLSRSFLRYAATVSMAYLTNRAVHHLRKHVFNLYLRFGKLYFDRTSVGHHSTVLMQFTAHSMVPMISIDKFFNAVFSLAIYLTVLAFISWKLTIVALPLFVILHISVRSMIERIKILSKSLAENVRNLGKKTTEILSTIPLVKAYGTQEIERTYFSSVSDMAATLDFRKLATQHIMRPIQESITVLAFLCLFTATMYLLVYGESVNTSSFLVYFYVIMNAANKFVALTGFRGEVVSCEGPIAEVEKIMDLSDKHIIPDGTLLFDGLKKQVEFRNVHFAYPGGKEVLRGMSFTMKKGGITAIVGSTGAGKTTLINLILRYYDCPPASIFTDDTDIRDFKVDSLLQHMALVSQETLLLHRSLRENICYGSPGIDDARLWEVIRMARLEAYIKGLPSGLDTLIGDRGVKLSGGEKQRVSIARALLKGADILILDEATSSLDSTTERLVQEAIDEAIRGKTAIVIAHRLSTIKNADMIVVIEDGTCIEQGTLDELLARKGKFHELWEAQKFS